MGLALLLPLLLVAAILLFRGRARQRVRSLSMGEIEARQLLGVGVTATPADILAAHRQRIAAVHPDRQTRDQGTQAARINAARDYLLAQLGQNH